MHTSPTDKFILKKDHLTPFLRQVAKQFRLVAPVKNPYGDTVFTVVDATGLARIDLADQPQNSAKAFFFPQEETILTYHTGPPSSYSFEGKIASQPTVYFGLRSCDLSAILYMDVIFLKNRDPYYLQRRNDSLLISFGCNNPFANCFCSATQSGPFLEYGYDLQFSDLGDRFFVEAGRAKGEELIRQWAHFFTRADEGDVKAQYQVLLEARGRFKQQVTVDQAIKILASGPVPQSIWSKLSPRCQDCGGCAYICPTCTCFTIRDQEQSPTTGARIRSWDACTFAGFTRMAGGHNPVETKTEAVKKRFLHKLLHDVKKHGRTSCVGCGRCVGICFGGVDIVRFIKMVCEQQEADI